MHVYVMGWNSTRPRAPVKIGVANDVCHRRDLLQTGSPFPLEIAYSSSWLSTEEAYAAEAEAHRSLDVFRLTGEWFNVDSSVAVQCVKILADGDIPVAKTEMRFAGQSVDEFLNWVPPSAAARNAAVRHFLASLIGATPVIGATAPRERA